MYYIYVFIYVEDMFVLPLAILLMADFAVCEVVKAAVNSIDCIHCSQLQFSQASSWFAAMFLGALLMSKPSRRVP